MRNLGLPRELEQQGRVVKGTGRGIHDMAADAAVLTGRKRFLTEFQ